MSDIQKTSELLAGNVIQSALNIVQENEQHQNQSSSNNHHQEQSEEGSQRSGLSKTEEFEEIELNDLSDHNRLSSSVPEPAIIDVLQPEIVSQWSPVNSFTSNLEESTRL